MKKQHGYNLVELMIVVAIVGIIAAIAYPSYTEQLRQSRRAECAGGLTSLGSAMERYYTVNNTYVGAEDGSGDLQVFTTTCPVDGGTATYNLTISAAAASTYTVQAAPTGAQTKDKCGTLTLNNRGLKGITGAATGLTAQDCW